MAGAALKKAEATFFTENGLRALVASILTYWGIFAVVLPVTNSDSQVYNLARLSIAERAGFWQAPAWNSIRQVIFPWTFDAIHYPLLKLGWGFALPSFLAFLGMLIIIYKLVAARFSPKVALWSVLSILAMPTVMLQATTTKNDLVVAFGVGCWLYSLVRFLRKEHRFFLFSAALSLAFTMGCKTSALPICAVLVFVTAWFLRRQRRNVLWFLLFFGPLLIAYGSVESYALSWRVYQGPVGPPRFVVAHINQDGIRGAAANFIRYYVANISTGIDGIDCRSGFPEFLEEKCRWLLGMLHLSNAGFRTDFSDAKMPFLKDGSDSGSDYGLVGFLALFVSSVVIWRPKFEKACWILAALGFALLVFACFEIAWMPWNARYLCLSFILFGVSFALLVFTPPNERSWKQIVVGLIIIWSAISLPMHCGQRKPLDFWNAFFARSELSLKQRLDMKPVYDDVLNLRANKTDRWFLVSAENSWTLPFLTMPELDWKLTPHWDQVLAASQKSNQPDGPFALVLNTKLPQNLAFDLVKSYPSSTFILKIRSEVDSSRPSSDTP